MSSRRVLLRCGLRAALGRALPVQYLRLILLGLSSFTFELPGMLSSFASLFLWRLSIADAHSRFPLGHDLLQPFTQRGKTMAKVEERTGDVFAPDLIEQLDGESSPTHRYASVSGAVHPGEADAPHGQGSCGSLYRM
jgi:hypothetical protein